MEQRKIQSHPVSSYSMYFLPFSLVPSQKWTKLYLSRVSLSSGMSNQTETFYTDCIHHSECKIIPKKLKYQELCRKRQFATETNFVKSDKNQGEKSGFGILGLFRILPDFVGFFGFFWIFWVFRISLGFLDFQIFLDIPIFRAVLRF